MKRIIAILVSILLLSSCVIPEENLSPFSTNPFLEAKAVVVSDSNEIVFFTDAHIGRERTRDDVTRYDENFFSFLDKGDYPIIVSGGDMADDGGVSPELLSFVSSLSSRSGSIYIEAIGNHDRHTYKYKTEDVLSFWYNSVFNGDTLSSYADAIFSSGAVYSTGRYELETTSGEKLLSLYCLDNSKRSYTERQLRWLEEALRVDDAPFRIIVSHGNIITGGELDQSLFMTGFGDEGEIARFLSICDKGKVSLVLSGHHHKGNILYGDGSGYTEFNGSAYHGTDSVFEGKGWWYTVELDRSEGTITIKGFEAESGEEKKRWRVAAKL